MNANKMFIRYVPSQDEICIAKVGAPGAPVLVIPASEEALVASAEYVAGRAKRLQANFLQRLIGRVFKSTLVEAEGTVQVVSDTGVVYDITVRRVAEWPRA